MSAEITHRSPLRVGFFLWALGFAFIGGWVMHGYVWADTATVAPCPAVRCTELPPEVGR